VNVANCFTKSRPAALAPLAGERIVSDAPRSHWPANELFQTLNFWARTVFKDCYFSHYLYTLLTVDRI